MKSLIVAPLLIISLLGTSVAVFAQPHEDNHGGGQPSHNRPNPGQEVQHGHGRGPAPRDTSSGGRAVPFPTTIRTRGSGFRQSTEIVITLSKTGTSTACKRRRAGISG
jgi:hypothetical protein